MKYCVLVMDGAAGLPLPERGGKTCLELAQTPNLDAMASEGSLGLVRTVPPGMEPSSACACMSLLGYDPQLYYRGRAGIEARSLGIPVGKGEVVFRCNLVAVEDGKMLDYSAGHISTAEAQLFIDALNENLGNDRLHFYPGLNYRHILKIKDGEDTLAARCTPPHDIPGQPIGRFLPHGLGSELLNQMMERSAVLFREHPLNLERKARGAGPVSMVWLFWGSGQIPEMPSFREVYGLKGALTSAVDLLYGLAEMAGLEILKIPGVTDGPDNDYAAQAGGALAALEENDLVVIHIEAPDEAGHSGAIDEKVTALRSIDREVVARLRSWRGDSLRVLVMPDHPTPIALRTHTPDPVPFLLWGKGFEPNGTRRFTESAAAGTGLFVDPGYNIMEKLTFR